MTEALSEARLWLDYKVESGNEEAKAIRDHLAALFAENERLRHQASKMSEDLSLCNAAAERADKAEAERDGADERSKILLAAKNEWADKARQAAAERDEARTNYQTLLDAQVETIKECSELEAEVVRLKAQLPITPPYRRTYRK